MEKTCKTCINLCNKRGEVCQLYKGEVQEMLKEIDSTIYQYGTNPFFISSFNQAIKEIEPTYKSLITIVEKCIENRLS